MIFARSGSPSWLDGEVSFKSNIAIGRGHTAAVSCLLFAIDASTQPDNDMLKCRR